MAKDERACGSDINFFPRHEERRDDGDGDGDELCEFYHFVSGHHHNHFV